MLKRKARLIGNSIVVTIPKDIAEYLKIEKGNTLDLDVEKNKIIITKKEI